MFKHNTSSAFQLGTNFSQKREKYPERMKTQAGLSNAWVPRFIVYLFFFFFQQQKTESSLLFKNVDPICVLRTRTTTNSCFRENKKSKRKTRKAKFYIHSHKRTLAQNAFKCRYIFSFRGYIFHEKGIVLKLGRFTKILPKKTENSRDCLWKVCLYRN